MIFYFSGTGNSRFAAKTLAHDGEEVISMIDAVRSKAFRCTLKENEPLGFVFPVYFYTVSDPVLELVRNLTVENASFVYAVIPCGASIGAAGGLLREEDRVLHNGFNHDVISFMAERPEQRAGQAPRFYPSAHCFAETEDIPFYHIRGNSASIS